MALSTSVELPTTWTLGVVELVLVATMSTPVMAALAFSDAAEVRKPLAALAILGAVAPENAIAAGFSINVWPDIVSRSWTASDLGAATDFEASSRGDNEEEAFAVATVAAVAEGLGTAAAVAAIGG